MSGELSLLMFPKLAASGAGLVLAADTSKSRLFSDCLLAIIRNTMSVMKHYHSNRHYLSSVFYIALTLLASGWLSAADDAGGLDMNALASLASTLGSNPQIMSMVSGLFNQNSAKPSSSSGSGAGANGLGGGFDAASAATAPVSSDQDSNQPGVAPDAAGMPHITPRSSPVQQPRATKEASPIAAAAPASPTSGSSSSLSSLMSLLPALTQGGAKMPAIPQVPPAAAAASVAAAPPPLTASQPVATFAQTPPAAQPAAGAAAGGNPAQAVINQVLTAYASGQIPLEIIQLGLSGRVPPQIMELALSGQVPPQIVQMVITGQIPMSTINAFLGTMQPAASSRATSAAASDATAAATATGSGAATASTGGAGGIISSTRALVEALFKPSANGGRKIMVPTLLGPLPIQIPNIPSVRQFGQMVGSSITNMASMVPF